MAAPVINSTTSVLGFRQWLDWVYQPTATNDPYKWTCTGLPDGMSIDHPTQYSATASTGDVVTASAGFVDGDRIVFTSLTGGVGLAINTIYYVLYLTTTTFKVSLTPGGTAVDVTTAYTGGLVGKIQTGRISGAATVPGIYEAVLTAYNLSDGASAEFVLTIGIEESAILNSSGVDLTIDLGTLTCTSSSTTSTPDPTKPIPVLYAKENDNVLLIVRFTKVGTGIDMNLSSLKFGVKEFEPDQVITMGGGASFGTDFNKFGSGANAYWVIPVHFDGALLASALSDNEDDAGTIFNALAEIEWIETTSWPGVGPSSWRRTSRTFWVTVERDIISEN